MRWHRYLWDSGAWFERRAARQLARGETECGLRVIDGGEPGLSGRWKHGLARVSAGIVEFRPGMGGGVRFPKPGQRWLRIEVLEASRAQERTAGVKESWSVSGQVRILRLRSPNAEIEWAVVPQHREALLAMVQGTDAS